MEIDLHRVNENRRPSGAGAVNAPIAGADSEPLQKSLESQRIQAELTTARIQDKHEKLKRTVLLLALPYVVLLSPVLFLLAPPYLVYRLMGLRDRRRKTRTVVFDAFWAFTEKGLPAAMEILSKHPGHAPSSAEPLFRSMAAQSDAEWLAEFRGWAEAEGLPSIALVDGDEPRFERIRFARVNPVPAPHKVSVIMPAFNAEKTIERAARSILDQSWTNLELIIVNDMSNDSTATIIDRLAQEDERVIAVHNGINVGPYVSKNRALGHASGSFVTGHDADDLATPDRIALQMAPLLGSKGGKASLAHMIRLDADGKFCFPSRVGNVSHDGISRRAYISLLFDRRLLDKHLGYWDSVRFAADSEMLDRTRLAIGKDLKVVKRTVMLCLDAAHGLTNQAGAGIHKKSGISAVRRLYQYRFEAWHRKAGRRGVYLEFPQATRRFDAPESMLVPDKDVIALLSKTSEDRPR